MGVRQAPDAAHHCISTAAALAIQGAGTGVCWACSSRTRRQFARHVPFLGCPSARPPQGPMATVVLWKMSAPLPLWPDVVIRNSYKKRQIPGEEAGPGSPRQLLRTCNPSSLVAPGQALHSRHRFLFRTA